MNTQYIIQTRPRITNAGWVWVGIAAFTVGWVVMLAWAITS